MSPALQHNQTTRLKLPYHSTRAGRFLARAARALPVVALVVGVSSLAAEAQPAKVMPRVGVLRAQPSTDPHYQAFLRGLRELGYTEGKDIAIEYRRGEISAFSDLAKELVRLNVDVILAPTPQAARAAREATATIPIVFAVVGDPVRTGLVASLARPGGNITGLTALGSDLGGKRLELLKEFVPRLSRVAVLWNPTVPDKVVEWQEMEGPARAMRLQLQSFEVRVPGDFGQALDAIKQRRVEGLIVLAEPLTFGHRTRIIEFAAGVSLPTIFNWREAVEAGALIAYGPNIADLHRRSASYVVKILKGAKAAELPVEQPMKFELVINGRTAKALGLTIPQSVLIRTDKVIE